MNPQLKDMVSRFDNDISFKVDDELQNIYALIENFVYHYQNVIPGMSNIDPREVKSLVSRYFADINNISFDLSEIIHDGFSVINRQADADEDVKTMERYYIENVSVEIRDRIKECINNGLRKLEDNFLTDFKWEIMMDHRLVIPSDAIANLREKIFSKIEEQLYDFLGFVNRYTDKRAVEIIDEYIDLKKKDDKKEETNKQISSQAQKIWQKLQESYNVCRSTIISDPALTNTFQSLVLCFKSLCKEDADFNDLNNNKVQEFHDLLNQYIAGLRDNLNKKAVEAKKEEIVPEPVPEKPIESAPEVRWDMLEPLPSLDNPLANNKFKNISEETSKVEVTEDMNPTKVVNPVELQKQIEEEQIKSQQPRAFDLL